MMVKNNNLKMVLFLIGISIAFFILFAALLYTSAYSQVRDDDYIRRKAEDEYLNKEKSTKRLRGDYKVHRNDIIYTNLVVTRGDVTVEGIIEGDLLVVFGDIDIRADGKIKGDAISISGNIYVEENSVIYGELIETSWRRFSRADRYRDRNFRIRFDDRTIFRDDDYPDEIVFDYNRIDGLFFGFNLGADIKRRYRSYFERNLNLYGFLGYGFKSSKWRYRLGLEKLFFDENPFSIGIEMHSLTDSDDEWLIGKIENALASILIKEDFKDYFERNGYAGFISQSIGNYTTLKLEYRIDNYKSLEKNASWSLFGSKKNFRDNPPINEGEMKSVFLDFEYNNKDDYHYPRRGWNINMYGELADKDFGGDFDFKRIILDLRRYQSLSRYESIDFRIRTGSSSGYLPLQKIFYVGGLGSLRGYNFKEFFGNRMFLANFEYRFDPDRILIGPPSWFFDGSFDIILFSDYGLAWNSDQDAEIIDLLSGTKIEDFKSSVGFGIGDKDNGFRVNFAWRTDIKDNNISVYLRLNETF